MIKNSHTNQLVFLISQPRAGSTMTQKILGGHSGIHTQSEPWILLHPLHALREDNINASYNQNYYRIALEDFCANLPGGKEQYIETIAAAYYSFYESILEQNNKNIFLDKTPRYYLIIEELLEYFPESKIILLIRNPMAVLNSIISTWSGNDLSKLANFKQDLLLAPEIFVKYMQKGSGNILSVKYENLITAPDDAVRDIARYLDVEYEAGMINYGDEPAADGEWKFGDQETVYKKIKPDAKHAEAWINAMHEPQIWRLQKEYFEALGPDIFQSLGYEPGNIEAIIEDTRPAKSALKCTHSLTAFLEVQGRSQLPSRKVRQAAPISRSKEYILGYVILHPVKAFIRIIRRLYIGIKNVIYHDVSDKNVN